MATVPVPVPVIKLSKRARQRKNRNRNRKRELELEEPVLPATAVLPDQKIVLQERLRGVLAQRRSQRTGELARKVKTATNEAGVDIRRGDSSEDVLRRLGLGDLQQSPIFQTMQNDPRTKQALQQMNPGELTRALQLLQRAEIPVGDALLAGMKDLVTNTSPEDLEPDDDDDDDDDDDVPEFILATERAMAAGEPVDMTSFEDPSLVAAFAALAAGTEDANAAFDAGEQTQSSH
jgi:hypothetical protein